MSILKQSSSRANGLGVRGFKKKNGDGSVRVLEVGMKEKWRIILRWPPLYSVVGWKERYAVLMQEFRSTGKPVERQFMQSEHRPIKNIRTISTGSAQNRRMHPQRGNSGGRVYPSTFPNQQGTSTILKERSYFHKSWEYLWVFWNSHQVEQTGWG